MILYFSSLAQNDLTEIGAYIAQDNPSRAASFLVEIKRSCEGLISFPFMGKERNELRKGLRSLFWGSYVIFYEVRDAQIRILRILHGSRDINRLLS